MKWFFPKKNLIFLQKWSAYDTTEIIYRNRETPPKTRFFGEGLRPFYFLQFCPNDLKKNAVFLNSFLTWGNISDIIEYSMATEYSNKKNFTVFSPKMTFCEVSFLLWMSGSFCWNIMGKKFQIFHDMFFHWKKILMS